MSKWSFFHYRHLYFAIERLDGDINLLRNFDLRTLSGDDKYGADNVLSRMKIVRAIMSLAFADCWPDLNYDSIEHYKYNSGYINYTNDIFGGSILDEYFKGMDKYHPNREQHLRAVKVNHMMDTIGNFDGDAKQGFYRLIRLGI